jgi:hypothetical protein
MTYALEAYVKFSKCRRPQKRKKNCQVTRISPPSPHRPRDLLPRAAARGYAHARARAARVPLLDWMFGFGL